MPPGRPRRPPSSRSSATRRCGSATSVAICSPRSPTSSGRRRPRRSPPASSTCGCTRPTRLLRHARLVAEHGPRFLCGIGISHRPLIDSVVEAGTYQKPIDHDVGVPRRARRRVYPARRRGSCHRRARTEDARAGPHPHRGHAPLPGHARADRSRPDRGRPRQAGRQRAGRRVGDRPDHGARHRPHRTSACTSASRTTANNWKRQGFTDDDIADGGSDRLVDALIAWGDEATIAARVQDHRDAGADHVCIQVLADDPNAFPLEQWRALAAPSPEPPRAATGCT